MFTGALTAQHHQLRLDCEDIYYRKNRPFALFIFKKRNDFSHPRTISFSDSDVPTELLQGIKKIKHFPFTFFSFQNNLWQM